MARYIQYGVLLAFLALECTVALRLATTVVDPVPQTCIFHKTFDRIQQDADFGINADPDTPMEICKHNDVEDVYYHGCVADLNEYNVLMKEPQKELQLEKLPLCNEEVVVHHACNKVGTPHRIGLMPTCDSGAVLQKGNTQKGTTYGCCNGEFDDNCQATTCTCDSKQAFAYKDLPGHLLSPHYVSSLLAKAKIRKLIFIGDSTTRRLFYAFCAYFGEKTFWDRHGVYQHDITCPEDGFSDQGVADANKTLHFKWAPTLYDLEKRRKFESGTDIIITTIYHHDRVLNTQQFRRFPQGLVEWGTSVTKENSHATVVLAGANLLAGADKQDINKGILHSFQQINAIAPKNNRLITVDNQWMQTEMGSALRDPCLGDTGGSAIHIRYGVGQFLRMLHVLAAVIHV